MNGTNWTKEYMPPNTSNMKREDCETMSIPTFGVHKLRFDFFSGSGFYSFVPKVTFMEHFSIASIFSQFCIPQSSLKCAILRRMVAWPISLYNAITFYIYCA